MSLKLEFVTLALSPGANIRQLCLRFQITPRTGYKWIQRYQAGGMKALQEQSRRPHQSPARTEAHLEDLVLALRETQPTWGGRKIRQVLLNQREVLLNQGHLPVPSASTITEILRRHGKLNPLESQKHQPFQRFEHPAPNDLWQMDFKGHFALTDFPHSSSSRCHPLTILDDYSRFNICLQACADEKTETVQQELTKRFRLYGLPTRMLMDNGSPWGTAGNHATDHRTFSRLELWLMRLEIGVCHGRSYHPQTQGKEERFHRTLKADLLHFQGFTNLAYSQQRFDEFRQIYNHDRPHEGIGMTVPASRYQSSSRSFPEVLPTLEYGCDDQVRKVQQGGSVRFQGRTLSLCKSLTGYPVAFRAQQQAGLYHIFFAQYLIGQVDLNRIIK